MIDPSELESNGWKNTPPRAQGAYFVIDGNKDCYPIIVNVIIDIRLCEVEILGKKTEQELTNTRYLCSGYSYPDLDNMWWKPVGYPPPVYVRT